MPAPKPILEDELICEILCYLQYANPEERYAVNIAGVLNRERAFIYKKLVFLEEQKLVFSKKEQLHFKTLFEVNASELKRLFLEYLKEKFANSRASDELVLRILGYDEKVKAAQFKRDELINVKSIEDLSLTLMKGPFLDACFNQGLSNFFFLKKINGVTGDFNLKRIFNSLRESALLEEDIKTYQRKYPESKREIESFRKICVASSSFFLDRFCFVSSNKLRLKN